MLIVHHLNNSRSQRILWLLEELDLPYDIRHYQRDPRTMLAPASLKAVHPLGKSPILQDGDTVVAESGAIIEYVLERFGNGRLVPPPGTKERLRYTQALHYAEGSVMPPLLLKLVFRRIEQGPMPFFVKPIAKAISAKVNQAFIQPQLDLHLGFLESQLAERPWFAGEEFTAADIQLSFPIEAAAARVSLAGRYPFLDEWLSRIQARPAFQRAAQRGGPFSLE